MDAGVLQTHGITSSLHHLSSTLTRLIQFKEFRVHVVFNGFPTLRIGSVTQLFHSEQCRADHACIHKETPPEHLAPWSTF